MVLVNWIATCRRMKLDLYLLPCTGFNSKRIKDLNIKPENLNLAEEKVRNAFELTGLGKGFLNRILIARALIPTIFKVKHFL